ncbi:MAG: hypothetical protein PVH51_02020 [Thiohalophilus sp.]
MLRRHRQCELCGRNEPGLTKHHLIPRTRHRNKRVKKLFSQDEMTKRILRVCRPCHHHIHRVLDEKQLALEYNTRDKLLDHPEIRQFVDWLASKPAGFKPRSSR